MNIKEDVKGLDFIRSLRPVTYNLDIPAYNKHILAPNNSEQDSLSAAIGVTSYSGFIAQEVEAAAKNAGYNFSGVHHPDNEHDTYTLSYAEFVVPLVKAVQELQAQNQELRQQQEKMVKELVLLTEQMNSYEMSSKLTTNK
ncbi:MAG: tail fiber domain-containing protein [Bacteroidetes bacterium]|nr:tail fiber domain-containing protein [Bacteroidota bacterium]